MGVSEKNDLSKTLSVQEYNSSNIDELFNDRSFILMVIFLKILYKIGFK